MSASALPATALGCPETRPMRPPILANANVVVMLTTMARRTRRKKDNGDDADGDGDGGKGEDSINLAYHCDGVFGCLWGYSFCRAEQWLRGWNRGRVGQLQQVQLGGSMSELCVELFGYPFLYTLLYPRHSLASRVAAVSKTRNGWTVAALFLRSGGRRRLLRDTADSGDLSPGNLQSSCNFHSGAIQKRLLVSQSSSPRAPVHQKLLHGFSRSYGESE
ncbi:hypothetical protein KC359_g86 [Hortaea werneckii]|nr:hypothetical protein KC359_g86 [Hortaea werneckii]